MQTELAELKAADEADKEAEKVEQEQEKASEGSDEAEQGETAASEKSAEESTPKEAEKMESAEEEVTEENDPDDTDEKKAAANRERRKKERESRRKELNDQKRRLEKAHAAVESAIAASQMRWDDALEKWSKSDLSDNLLKAEWMHAAGKVDEALKLVDKEIDSKSGQILPLAQKVFLLQEAEKFDDAEEVFNELRDLAWDADLDTPLLARLSPMAKFYGHESKWASEYKPADDLGDRPSLDTLGPFRWQPYLAPDFLVKDTAGKTLRMKKLKGKPTLLIFYLGFGCLHCVEQLHEFSPRADEFRRSGIEVMAISTESEEELGKALTSYSDPLDIPLHADPRLAAFKAFRCYDDFEKQPLHGTFLIDPDGRILWQDISYEPFMDVDFAMEESHRLLNLAGYGDQLSEPVPSKVVK